MHVLRITYLSFLGERNVLPNVHALLHLPEAVEDLGPLWAHSCFPYENANGELLKLYHGSQSVEKQVCGILCLLGGVIVQMTHHATICHEYL